MRYFTDLMKTLTAAALAIKIEDVALLTPADVGLWNAHTVMLTAMVPQVTVVYFWGGLIYYCKRNSPHSIVLLFPAVPLTSLTCMCPPVELIVSLKQGQELKIIHKWKCKFSLKKTG